MANTEQVVREVIGITPILRRNLLRPMETSAAGRLPSGQASLLTVLRDGGAQTMAQLGQMLLVCRQQMTVLVEELIQKGLVTRRRGEADRRTVVLEITDSGLEMLLRQEEDMMRALYPIFDRYSDTQKATLMEMARTVREFMRG